MKKNQNQRRYESEFENEFHIERKLKATSPVFSKRTREKEVLEYGLDDEEDLRQYERYLK